MASFRSMQQTILRTGIITALAIAMSSSAGMASAQVPKGDLFFGYSRLGTDAFYPNVGGLNGWEATGHFKVGLPFLGAEADVARYGTGANDGIPRTTTFLFGPRVTLGAVGVHIFAHGLIGTEHSSNSDSNLSISQTDFAYALGGGLDVPVLPFFAWRVQGDRIEAPSISPSEGTHARFTTGLVFRF